MVTGEFISLVISIIANLVLAVIVLRYSPKAQSKIFFSLFCLFQAIWVMVNYLSFMVSPGSEAWLNMGRLTMATAAFHPLFFFLFIYSFLRKTENIKYRYVILLFFVAITVAGLALSPWLFTHIEQRNGEYTPISGPAMPVFGFYVFTLIIFGFLRIFRKWHGTKGLEKAQWRFVGIGLVLTFLMVLGLSFLSLILFKKIETVKFSHLYTLPFVIFTTYAIVKHKLLDLKVVVAELSVLLLNVILFIRLLDVTNLTDFILNLVLFISGIIVGIILVKSILKEIKTKEELQLANKKLKQLDKAKTEFISITSHELRTPLTGLEGYLSMMKEGDFGELDEQKKNIVDQLARSTSRLIRLVNTFLNVSRIELGRLIINKSKIQLEKLVESSAMELQPEAIRKGLELKFERPKEKFPMLDIDQDKTKDVILNLIANAIKYTKEGSVKIWLEKTGGFIEFHVKDTGMGFSESEKPTFFKKFSRGRSSNLGIEGSGLGLFIASKIIQAQNGKIWCESPGTGKGSTFSFKLPIK